MKDTLDKLAAYCKDNKVEINVDKDDIGLWFTACGRDFSIVPIKSKDLEETIKIVNKFRKLKAVPV